MHVNPKYLNALIEELECLTLKCIYEETTLQVASSNKSINICFDGENTNENNNALNIPIDYVVTQHKKIVPIILSKLNLNATVFARNCKIEKLDKKTALDFFNTWHFFNATESAYNYGLIYKGELVGAASFSKGRKMNRLPTGKQSFELIRFCCKSGITITGGLSKLMSHFCAEKKAGDIMTYVDKQFSNGDSFIKAGFKKHSETQPLYFLINKTSFERRLFDKGKQFDERLFYITQNLGNLKLIYTPTCKIIV